VSLTRLLATVMWGVFCSFCYGTAACSPVVLLSLWRVQRPMATPVCSHPGGSPVKMVRPSVRLSVYARSNCRTAERIFMQYDTRELYGHLLRRLNFGLDATVVPTSVHDWGAEYLTGKETFRTDVHTNEAFCILYTFYMLRGLTFTTILRSAHTAYLCVLCGSENEQLLFPIQH
jgi:hypothetical protein